jgi:hypothetical protein
MDATPLAASALGAVLTQAAVISIEFASIVEAAAHADKGIARSSKSRGFVFMARILSIRRDSTAGPFARLS